MTSQAMLQARLRCLGRRRRPAPSSARLGVPAAAFARAPACRPARRSPARSIAAPARDQRRGGQGRHRAGARGLLAWRIVPAPRRGEFVRLLGEELRAAKDDLGRLVTLEAGKIASEGLGEVQEMIDICDFAVGLSRQLYGLTIATERADHRMMETWHPLGVCGVISAFNFPVAVWSWNAALAFVCGDRVVWKPSEKTPAHRARHRRRSSAARRSASAACRRASARSSSAGARSARLLVEDQRVPLVSATGSTAMGRQVGPKLAAPLRPRDPRARRQQRRDRRAVRRSRPGAARHRLRRHRHGGPALHDAAPPVRARERLRPPRAEARPRLRAACASAIRAPTAPWSAR